ncbi:noncompact myelin-associated protein [Echeneis naucrates]|uniref:noncompact myelin-associated protein n=1 Tax=Echeneis naucrates TaxID=173247 RepID=UPI00111340F4|nr:noncompact myelin-associated protein [Echeneis naucrates]
MQTSTVSPVTNTIVPSSTTAVTKTKGQILIQSSGAMIAVIVIGIIIILTILLLILKTYNKRTHASRVLGASGGSKPRPKMSQSRGQSSVPLSTMGINSVSSSIPTAIPTAAENGFHLPRVQLNTSQGNHTEEIGHPSDSAVVTVHDNAQIGNT